MSGVDVLPTLRGMADPNNEFHGEAVAAVAELIEAAIEMNRLAKGPAGGVSQADKRAIVNRMEAALANVTGGER